MAYHIDMGNLYIKNLPAATNSSVPHEQKDMNEVDDIAYIRCNTAMFFEFALFENLGGCDRWTLRWWIVYNGAHWA